jgi:hypothetical protein
VFTTLSRSARLLPGTSLAHKDTMMDSTAYGVSGKEEPERRIYTTSPTHHNGFQVESMPMLVVEKGAFNLVGR